MLIDTNLPRNRYIRTIVYIIKPGVLLVIFVTFEHLKIFLVLLQLYILQCLSSSVNEDIVGIYIDIL